MPCLTTSWALTFMSRPSSSKEHHVANSLLKPRSIFPKQNDWTRHPISNNAHARPDIDRSGDAIASFGHKDNSLLRCFLHPVNCLLKSIAIVGDTVAVNGKFIFREIDGLWIVKANRIVRGRQQGPARSTKNKNDNSDYSCGI